LVNHGYSLAYVGDFVESSLCAGGCFGGGGNVGFTNSCDLVEMLVLLSGNHHDIRMYTRDLL